MSRKGGDLIKSRAKLSNFALTKKKQRELVVRERKPIAAKRPVEPRKIVNR